jgi:proteic killer suppression protein
MTERDMDAPGYALHSLKGAMAGLWSVKVSGNWRVTFRFEDGDAYIVNYQDYHSVEDAAVSVQGHA